ncbi:MAG: hypothetical protein VX910_00060, partial [Candidatus Latescibacterota bacterium]|nr:hypothetical protein [Candidatus Latescibacterota bacterium]
MSRSRISWLRFSSPCLVSAVLAAAGLSAQSVGGPMQPGLLISPIFFYSPGTSAVLSPALIWM